jgi:hypothetical protein
VRKVALSEYVLGARTGKVVLFGPVEMVAECIDCHFTVEYTQDGEL